MSAVRENSLGKIEITDTVIANIAGIEASRCYGVVGMTLTGKTDGIISLLKRDSLSRGVKVIQEDDGFSLDIHIMVENGVNISAIGDNIISTVSYSVTEQTGIKLNKISVFVDAVRVS